MVYVSEGLTKRKRSNVKEQDGKKFGSPSEGRSNCGRVGETGYRMRFKTIDELEV